MPAPPLSPRSPHRRRAAKPSAAKPSGAAIVLCSALALLATPLGCTQPRRARHARLPAVTRLPNVASKPPVALTGPAGLPASIVAELANPDREVRFARNGNTGVLVTHSNGRWLTGAVTLDKDGRAKLNVPDDNEDGAMRQVAEAPDQQMLVSLQPRGDGFLLAWASAANNDDRIWVLQLDASGRAVREVQVWSAKNRQLRWIEVMSVGDHAFLLWESAVSGGSDLYVAALGTSTGPVSSDVQPTRIASRVNGWHAASHADGVAVSWVSGPNRDRGTPYFANISSSGEVGPSVTLSDEAGALLDVQTARVGDHHLIAWTDTRDDDHHIYLTRVDTSGKRLGAPAPAVAPVGAQGLVALLASQDGARGLLAWEPVLGPASGPRPIQMAALDSAGKVGARAVLQLWSPEGTPQLVADGDGFAALTLAPMQLQGGESLGNGPHYVRFDANLNIKAAEPIRMAELLSQSVGVEGVPAAVRTLNCQGALCTIVAVGRGEPALLAIASLPMRRSRWHSPAITLPPAAPPSAWALRTMAHSRRPLADVSAAKLDDGRTLIAYISDAPAAPNEAAPPRARLMYRFIAADGSRGRERVLSERAISIGGVKVIPIHADRAVNKRNPPVALIGWAAPTKGSSQVFVTQLDKQGNKLKQRTVTKLRRKQQHAIPNEVADIDMAMDRSGNILCAWTDTRNGDQEVYLARLAPNLQKTKMDRRITKEAGASLEPQLWVTADKVYLAWSDSRGESHNANIFMATFDAKTLKERGGTRQLSDSPAHARTPQWSGSPDGHAWLSWIEEPHAEAAASLQLLTLGEDQPRRLVLPAQRGISSVAVRCSSELGCRGTLLAGADGPLEAFAFQAPNNGQAAIAAKSLALLGAPSAQDLALVAADREVSELYFLQRRDSGQAVRQLRIDW